MEILRFGLLGLGTGAIYAMLAQGLVLVYRSSGVLNFGQGAVAMFGAYAYYGVTSQAGLPSWLGLVTAVVLSGLLGALVQIVILRPMRSSSPLARLTATLALTLVLQSSAFLAYGANPLQVKALLSGRTIHILTMSLPLGLDRIEILVIGVMVTAGLAAIYRFTAVGRVTTAVAENRLAAATAGHSPDLVAAMNWGVASALAGLAGVLIAPIIFLEPTGLVLLVLPAMAAALVSQFSSFVVSFVAALALGVIESEIQRYVSAPGWSSAAPFVVVIGLLMLRGRAIAARSFLTDRLPSVGRGKVRPGVAGVGYGIIAVLVMRSGLTWASAWTSTFAVAIVALSVVVITGYAGQLSLAQGSMAGIGALVAAKIAGYLPFLAALLVAALCAALAGGVIGITALRIRGASLAVATLALSTAISGVVLTNYEYTGGFLGITVPIPHVLGWNIDPFLHANRYAFVALTLLVLLAIAVANLRRGAVGRRLLAVRSNETAAAALGLNNARIKTYAFALSSALAAVGGVLLAFAEPSVRVSQIDAFTVFSGIVVVAVTVAGGVGSAGGALIASLMIAGGIASKLFAGWSQINEYLPLFGGVSLIVVLVVDPDGAFEINRRKLSWLTTRLDAYGASATRRLGIARPRRDRRSEQAEVRDERTPQSRVDVLEVKGVTVRFGGVVALRDVGLQIRPGEVHGLIGPNGAGKTTLIDAITGLVPVHAGTIHIGNQDISRHAPHHRAAAGVSRSFQTLELFADLSVLENLAVASEARDLPLRRYLTDLVMPQAVRLGSAGLAALDAFDLAPLADRLPTEISFGQRKAVAIARAVAASPGVLLLDEPAAGLNDHEASELALLIRRLATEWGIGVLLVEHKIDMIMSISDRVTVLQGGRVLTSGPPSAVRADPAVVDAYLGTHAEPENPSVPTAAAR